MANNIKEQKKRIVYVLCPANYVTGGPDALHQIVFYLNEIGVNAKIVYVADSSQSHISIPTPYSLYIDSFLTEKDIVDVSENYVIIPEVLANRINDLKNVKIFLWWLSVNNNEKYRMSKKLFYFFSLPLRIVKNWWYYKKNFLRAIRSSWKHKAYSFQNESLNIVHLCASYYAYDYVSHKTKNSVIKCIEPISKRFLNLYLQEKENITKSSRKDIILYNPVRKYDNIIKLISSLAPELQFEPLRGLTQQQLVEKYKSSKLYVDFGAFPGAERIPKEAVLFGCAVITGKKGASGYYGDVPIPSEYKFGNPKKQINEIVNRIRYVLNNFDKVYSDFNKYRQMVLNLECNFVKSLECIFFDFQSR